MLDILLNILHSLKHLILIILHSILESKVTQQTSEYNKKRSRPPDIENKLVVTSEKREGGRGNVWVED